MKIWKQAGDSGLVCNDSSVEEGEKLDVFWFKLQIGAPPEYIIHTRLYKLPFRVSHHMVVT